MTILEFDDVDTARLLHACDGADPAGLDILGDESALGRDIPARGAFRVKGIPGTGKDIAAVSIDIHGGLRYQGRVRSQGTATPCEGRLLRVVLALEACDC